MTIESAYVGEDVPLTVVYDDGGTDPDDTDADGTPDASITITNNDDGTEVVSSAAMAHQSTGTFEYVWDTSTLSTGHYGVEVSAEFGGETKLAKDKIELKN